MAMTEQEIRKHKTRIDGMSQLEMCRLHRFPPPGHPYFVSGTDVQAYWALKFKGFTPEISKAIGWG